MPLPTTKQRIWQALRINPSLTLNELCMIVEASKGVIAEHLRGWIWKGVAQARLQHRIGKGRPPLVYSLVDRKVIDPP